MIQAAEFNFVGSRSMVTETDYRQELCLRDSADDVLDLSSGWKVRLDIRDDDSNLILRFDSVSGGVTLGSTDPNIVLTATDSETDIAAGKYDYDLRIENDDDSQEIYLRGAFHVVKSITEVL